MCVNMNANLHPAHLRPRRLDHAHHRLHVRFHIRPRLGPHVRHPRPTANRHSEALGSLHPFEPAEPERGPEPAFGRLLVAFVAGH